MIKRTLVVIFLTLICIKGYSQSKFAPEWNFGANFGATLSNMSFVATDQTLSLDTKMLQQFKGGVSARYISEKNLGFIAELNYSQQGYEQKFGENLLDLQYSRTLTYLQIPFLTHIYFGDKSRVFVNLGPQVGFLIGDSEKYNSAFSTWLATPPDATTNLLDQYDSKAKNKIDYGLLFGLGFELRTGIGSFALEGRYYLGFADIYSNHKTDPFSRSANRVISGALTYYIKPF